MRALRRTLALLVAVLGLSLLTAPAALAHNVLISSNPADGATVAAGLAEVSFTFDQPLQDFDPLISVTGPDGRRYQSGDPRVVGNVISSAIALGPAGQYIAAYRVVSADGHPVTGQITFTTSGSGTATGLAPTGGAAPAADRVGTESSGLASWIWITLGVAAVIIAAAAVLLLRRPRRG